MLKAALLFFIISLITGALGFTGLASGFAVAAKTLFFVALTMFVIFLIAGLIIGETLFGKE